MSKKGVLAISIGTVVGGALGFSLTRQHRLEEKRRDLATLEGKVREKQEAVQQLRDKVAAAERAGAAASADDTVAKGAR
eukprot:m.321732 g.321732  ORF g.321732 m.321732 type:complete len:79 (-) comp25795_c0_seq1:193-429(-)